MAASRYDELLRLLLAHEGGYSNNPSDPGGPTNFGITLADYRAYVMRDGTAADVKAMRRDQATAIYRAKYWDAMRCDELPDGLDYALFDYGVNSGINRAIAVLQRLLSTPASSRISDAAIAAAARCDVADMVGRLCDERMTFLRKLKTWPVFGTGWTRRVADVRSTALAMAHDAVTPAPAPPAAVAARTAAAGGVAAAAAVAAQQVHAAGLRPAVVVIAACVVLGLAAAGWAAWRWRRRSQPSISGEHP